MSTQVEWRHSPERVDYPTAVTFMEQRVQAIHKGDAPEMVWLLEHPPIYTAGTSATPSDFISPPHFPVYPTGRGGQITYHGPGQRIAYVMLDVRRRGKGTPDVKRFVRTLEEWLIASLKILGVTGERREGRVGIWVKSSTHAEKEDKIAAIGIRIRHGISYHGVAINVAPDLDHFSHIVPCGIRGHGVTSLKALGTTASMAAVDDALHKTFNEIFEENSSFL